MHCARLMFSVLIECNKFILTLTIVFISNSCNACEPPTIVFPAQHAEVLETRPVISWLPAPGAARYDVSVQSRIPEGEVSVQFSSTTTDSQFASPRPLTRERAVVAVKVKAHCGVDVSAESTRIFFADVRALCPLPRGLLRVPMGQFERVSWLLDARFETVEVRWFGAASVGTSERVPRSQNFAVLPTDAAQEGVLGVRGICGEADGGVGVCGAVRDSRRPRCAPLIRCYRQAVGPSPRRMHNSEDLNFARLFKLGDDVWIPLYNQLPSIRQSADTP